jgi:hypothetical protein
MRTDINSIGVQRILDRFDFEKVYIYMKSVNWCWGGLFNDPLHVPEISEMKVAAKELLELAAASQLGKHEEVSSGGFSATRYENGSLCLSFIISEFGDDDV